MTKGVAIIGLGLGQAYAAACETSKYADLLAVSDLLEDRMNKVKKRFPTVDCYKNYKELLERDDIDIVCIATPNFNHKDIALDVVKKGKHVFLEKPMALTLEDCDTLIEAAEREGVKLTIDFEMRLTSPFSNVKSQLKSGRMGRFATAFVNIWRMPFHVKPGWWSQQEKLCGGVLIESAVHIFDLLRWYGGDISQVHSLANKDGCRSEVDYPTTHYVNLKYKGEKSGTAQISFTLSGFNTEFIVGVVGTDASSLIRQIFSPSGCYSVLGFKRHPKDISEEYTGPVSYEYFGGKAYAEMAGVKDHVQNFIERIVKGEEPLVSPDDGRKSVELALAAEESERTGNVVDLPLSKSPKFALERAQTSKEDIDDYSKKLNEWTPPPYPRSLHQFAGEYGKI